MNRKHGGQIGFFLVMAAIFALVATVVCLVFAISMVDPHYPQITQAEEDLRICEMTEGCDTDLAQDRIDDWEEKRDESRQHYFLLFMGSSIPMVIGWASFLVASRINKNWV